MRVSEQDNLNKRFPAHTVTKKENVRVSQIHGDGLRCRGAILARATLRMKNKVLREVVITHLAIICRYKPWDMKYVM